MIRSGSESSPSARAGAAHAPRARALDAHAAPLVDLRVGELGRRLVGHDHREAPQEPHGDERRDDVGDVEEDEFHRPL